METPLAGMKQRLNTSTTSVSAAPRGTSWDKSRSLPGVLPAATQCPACRECPASEALERPLPECRGCQALLAARPGRPALDCRADRLHRAGPGVLARPA